MKSFDYKGWKVDVGYSYSLHSTFLKRGNDKICLGCIISKTVQLTSPELLKICKEIETLLRLKAI